MNENTGNERHRSTDKKPCFTIDSTIKIEVDFTLALDLADAILASKTPNKALQALALQLRNLEGA